MQRQYVAIGLHRWRSVVVLEDEAGRELGVTRIDNSPLALSQAVGEAGLCPQVAIEATAGGTGQSTCSASSERRAPCQPLGAGLG